MERAREERNRDARKTSKSHKYRKMKPRDRDTVIENLIDPENLKGSLNEETP